MGAIAPIFDDFDKELEKHLFTQKSFYINSRLCADCFEFNAAFADNDSFLRASFDKNRAMNSCYVRVGFIILFGNDRRYIRNFVARCLQNLFAHHFRNECSQRLVGEFIFAENCCGGPDFDVTDLDVERKCVRLVDIALGRLKGPIAVAQQNVRVEAFANRDEPASGKFLTKR